MPRPLCRPPVDRRCLIRDATRPAGVDDQQGRIAATRATSGQVGRCRRPLPRSSAGEDLGGVYVDAGVAGAGLFGVGEMHVASLGPLREPRATGSTVAQQGEGASPPNEPAGQQRRRTRHPQGRRSGFGELVGVGDGDLGDGLREVRGVVRDEPVGTGRHGFAKGDRGTSPQCAFVSILLAWRALHWEQPAAGRSIDALRSRRRAWLDTVPARETDQSPDPADAAAGSTGQQRKARAALGHLDRALVAQERVLGIIAARVRRG